LGLHGGRSEPFGYHVGFSPVGETTHYRVEGKKVEKAWVQTALLIVFRTPRQNNGQKGQALVAKDPKISITFFLFVEKTNVYGIKGLYVLRPHLWA
jgi:hypothetical protein